MIEKFYNREMNKTVKKFLKTWINQDNSDTHIVFSYYKFVYFASTINQVILSNL